MASLLESDLTFFPFYVKNWQVHPGPQLPERIVSMQTHLREHVLLSPSSIPGSSISLSNLSTISCVLFSPPLRSFSTFTTTLQLSFPQCCPARVPPTQPNHILSHRIHHFELRTRATDRPPTDNRAMRS